MARFANCPGEDCQAKVKIKIDLDLQDEIINFCCVPCFEYTWKTMFSEDEGNIVVQGHSGGCWDRQSFRVHEPVVTGEFRIHTPKQAPPSRLGGQGGPLLP